MVNYSGRSPGGLEKFSGRGKVISDLPDMPVDRGEGFGDLQKQLAGLSNQLGALADAAAKKEGLAEGHAAGMSAPLPGEGGGAGSTAAQAQAPKLDGGGDRGQQARDYYVKLGYTRERAAGIVGNLMQESGLRVDAVGDNGTAFGIAQWRGERFERLKQFAASRGKAHNDYETQLAFVDYELRNHEKSAYAALQKATSVDEATAAMIGYERPAGWTTANPRAGHGWQNRLSHARRLAGDGGATLGTPLALRKGGGVRAEAANAAAMQSYGWRLESQISADISTAAQESKSPQELDEKLNKIRQTYEGSGTLNDPQMRPVFDKMWVEKTSIVKMRASTDFQNKLETERKASAGTALASARQDIERQAYLIGANPDGDKLLADQLTRAENAVNAAYETGAITPMQREQQLADVRRSVVASKIEGTYDALSTPDEKQKFTKELVQQWKEGKGGLAALPREDVEQITGRLEARSAKASLDQSVEARMQKEAVSQQVKDDLSSIAATGQGLQLDGRELDMNTVSTVLGPDAAVKWNRERLIGQKLYTATADLPVLSEDEIQERVESLAPVAGEEGYAEREALQSSAIAAANRILKLRKEDPAAAVGAAFPAVKAAEDALDPASPETFEALATERLKAQSAIGIEEFARDPLTRKEAKSLLDPLRRAPVEQAQQVFQDTLDGVRQRYGVHAEAVTAQLLRQAGADRDLSRVKAKMLGNIGIGEMPDRATARQADNLQEAADADTAFDAPKKQASNAPQTRGVPPPPLDYRPPRSGGLRSPTSGFMREYAPDDVRNSQLREKGIIDPKRLPNYKDQQLLRSRPDLSELFDQKFWPGAAEYYLSGARRADQAQGEAE